MKHLHNQIIQPHPSKFPKSELSNSLSTWRGSEKISLIRKDDRVRLNSFKNSRTLIVPYNFHYERQRLPRKTL